MITRYLAIAALAFPACPGLAVQAEVGDIVKGHPFRKYSTVDELDRRIKFFLSEPSGAAKELPLVVYVQGTGCSSHFMQGKDRISGGMGTLMYEVFLEKARVLIVDKSGVEFLDDQGESPMQESCRPQYFYEHTLDRWAEAIAASIRSAHTLPSVDTTSTLVVGHSEGGMVACRPPLLSYNLLE